MKTQFPIGNLYNLIHLSTKQALTIQKNKSLIQTQIISQKPDHQSIDQLWLIQQIHQGQYQIIHANSCIVLEVDGSKVYLRKGKQKSSQLWRIQSITIFNQKYYIFRKSYKNSKRALTINNGILQAQQTNSSNLNFLFKLDLVRDNYTVNRTYSIINVNSGKYLDVPEAIDLQGTNIIQYQKNLRFNQRWFLIHMGENYVIQSLKTKLNLQWNNESNYKIIQKKNNGQFNQRWILDKRQNGNYVIRSSYDRRLVFGVEENSKKDQAKIVISEYSPQCEWKIVSEISNY